MGIFNNFPYTNFHNLNLDWILKKIKALEPAAVPSGGEQSQVLCKLSDDDYDTGWTSAVTSFVVKGLYATLAALQAAHPTGTAGDAYAVGTSDSNVIYIWNVDTSAWTNVGTLRGPKGDTGATGATGPAGADGEDGEDGEDGVGVPTGGTTGQVLAKKSATDYDTDWSTLSIHNIPSGGSTGQVLKKTSGTDYAVEWGTVSSGGGFTPHYDYDRTGEYVNGGIYYNASSISGNLTIYCPVTDWTALKDSDFVYKFIYRAGSTVPSGWQIAAPSGAVLPTHIYVKDMPASFVSTNVYEFTIRCYNSGTDESESAGTTHFANTMIVSCKTYVNTL